MHSFLNRIQPALFFLVFAIIIQGTFLYADSQKDTQPQDRLKQEKLSIEGHPAFVIRPEKIDSTKPVPWVWYAPTLKHLPSPEDEWMFRKFLENGIAVAGIDVGESFGSPDGRKLFSELHKKLVENHHFSKKPCLLARSRGGLMLYNWAVENPDSVSAIAGIYPVCNLKSYPGLEKACGAYHMSEAELEENLVKNNPISRLAPLAKARVPVFHIHGDNDKVVPLEENSAIVKQKYDEMNGQMELKIIKGQGHNRWEGWFRDPDLISFVIEHVKADP